MERRNILPCAACKHTRQKCHAGCFFSQYFPSNNGMDYTNVFKVFGLARARQQLESIADDWRNVCVNYIRLEADMRTEDPVGGSARIVQQLQDERQSLKQVHDQDRIISQQKDEIEILKQDLERDRIIIHQQQHKIESLRRDLDPARFLLSAGQPTLLTGANEVMPSKSYPQPSSNGPNLLTATNANATVESFGRPILNPDIHWLGCPTVNEPVYSSQSYLGGQSSW